MAGSRSDIPPPLNPSRKAWRDSRRAWRQRTRRLAAAALLVVAFVLAAWLRMGGVTPGGAGRGENDPRAGLGASLLTASLSGESLRRLGDKVAGPAPSPRPAPPRTVWPTPINVLSTTHRADALRRIASDGCCAGAWWSEDSSSVLYLDKPAGAPVVSIYEAPLWPPGIPPRVADLALTRRAGGDRYLVAPQGSVSVAQDTQTGQQWILPTGGKPARVAQDGSVAVWWNARGDRGHYDAAVTVSAEALGGEAPRELVTLWGASVIDFLPGSREVLVVGRPIRNRADFVLAAVDVTTGAVRQLAKGLWLSDALLSPTGEWVAYMVSLDAAHPDANGLWLVSTAGGAPRRLPFVGAYRWRDGGRLVYVPATLDAASDEVWEYDAATGAQRRLLDPAAAPIRVANNDWSVAPDGSHLVFRSADDLSLWLVGLP